MNYKIVICASLIILFIITTVFIFENSGRESPCDSYGDVNNDGFVDELDIELVSKHVTGEIVLSDNAMLKADVNANDKVDIGDLSAIKCYVNGNIETFPVC